MGRDPPVGNPWSKGLSFVPSSGVNCVQNLSLNERTALNELMSDSDLIIKQGFGH